LSPQNDFEVLCAFAAYTLPGHLHTTLARPPIKLPGFYWPCWKERISTFATSLLRPR